MVRMKIASHAENRIFREDWAMCLARHRINGHFSTLIPRNLIFLPIYTNFALLMEHQYSSTLLERAVGEFAKLPGIGRKTALRLVLHMLRRPVGEAAAFAEAVSKLCRAVKY